MKVTGLVGHCAEAFEAASANAKPVKNARSIVRTSLHGSWLSDDTHFTGLVHELAVLVHDRKVYEPRAVVVSIREIDPEVADIHLDGFQGSDKPFPRRHCAARALEALDERPCRDISLEARMRRPFKPPCWLMVSKYASAPSRISLPKSAWAPDNAADCPITIASLGALCARASAAGQQSAASPMKKPPKPRIVNPP
jgi:hypothetical protein